MPTLPRLRQIAVVAADLDATAKALATDLELDEPFHDPGVAEFGLLNAVFAAGDTFIEVVSPNTDGTTAGRYLARHGDAGYMAIFQVADTPAARRRASAAGVRVVWSIDLDDISGTHFHPKDVPGAIVSVDTPLPPASWRWAGPRWTGGAPDGTVGGLVSVAVECDDPHTAARAWAELLGVTPDGDTIVLDDGRQSVVFRTGPAGIVEVTVAVEPELAARRPSVQVAGVKFRLIAAAS